MRIMGDYFSALGFFVLGAGRALSAQLTLPTCSARRLGNLGSNPSAMNIETVTRSARAPEQGCEVGIVSNSDGAYGCFRFGEMGVLFLTYYAHEAVDVNTHGGKCDISSSHQAYYSDTLRILNIIVQTVLAGFAFCASFRLWAF